MVATMLIIRSSTTIQTVLALLAASLLMAGSMNAAAAGKCAISEKKLKQEQFIILEREQELTLKTKDNKEKFDQKVLERLIERHHASIERFNMKLDEFNQNCKKSNSSKKSARVTVKSITPEDTSQAKPERTTRGSGGVMPEEEIAASDALIKTLQGRYIQIGAFRRKVIAEANQKKLSRKGFESIMITRPYVYAVWVGPYESYKEAKAVKESLLTELKFDGYIIRFK